MRITAKIAGEEITKINNILQKIKHPKFVKISPRYDYHGLDLFDDNGCIRTLKTGTPAKCMQAAYEYLCEIAVGKCLELMKD